MKLTGQVLPLALLHRLQPGCQRAQLGDRMLPGPKVAQEALDLPRSLIGLQKFVGRDVVGIFANNIAINYNRMGTNDAQYELRRKAIALVLAENSDIVVADKVVELGFVLDQTIGCCVFLKGPGHFPKNSQSRKLAIACLTRYFGQETDHRIRIKASGLKIGLLFAGHYHCTGPKVSIDVRPSFTEGLQDRS